jgi:hypothetical protein
MHTNRIAARREFIEARVYYACQSTDNGLKQWNVQLPKPYTVTVNERLVNVFLT